MKLYELTYLIPPNLSGDETKKLSERVISYLPKGGENYKTTSSFITLNFHALPEEISALEKSLKAEPQIKNYMILNKKISQDEFKVPKRVMRKAPKSSTEPNRLSSDREKKVELKEIEKKLDEILNE